MAKIVEQLCWQ